MHTATHQSEETTALHRKGSVMVRIGKSRWTAPLATIGACAMLLWQIGAWTVDRYQASRKAELDRIAAVESATAENARKIELQQALLVEIRSGVARLDVRLAEVQLVLMGRASR